MNALSQIRMPCHKTFQFYDHLLKQKPSVVCPIKEIEPKHSDALQLKARP